MLYTHTKEAEAEEHPFGAYTHASVVKHRKSAAKPKKSVDSILKI